MHPRTKRQKDVLEFITRFVARHGYEPSYQQIAWQLGVSSKAGIAKHIEALESQGLISRRRENGSFGLEIHSNNAMAGEICKIELIESDIGNGNGSAFTRSEIRVPNFLLGSLLPDEVFAFRTPDDSMIDKQICEGDIVLLESRSYAGRGDTVVALAYGRQMLLRRFFHAGTETELRPANPHHASMIFPSESVVVQGIFRGLLRPIPSQEN